MQKEGMELVLISANETLMKKKKDFNSNFPTFFIEYAHEL